MDSIRQAVNQCKKCDLHLTKKNYVFGEGIETAKIMFIGEAPTSTEDNEGRLFVGRAGKILEELLASINLQRGDIFIADILKCRPPENRAPKPNEVAMCTPYLDAQIEIIKPKVICTIGYFATHYILKKYGINDKAEGISKLHGKKFKARTITDTITIMPFYHPAVATYSPEMKKILLKDLKGLNE